MLKFVVVLCITATACGQLATPKDAKILKEQRFNAGDGRFGSAFAQEDGTVFREETTADGERVGQYSYVDNDGKTIAVRYTAGKEGFRILEGAHVPTGANGQSSAPFVATPAPATLRQVAAPVQQFIARTAAPFRQFQPRPQPQRVAAPVQPVQPAFNLQPATKAPRRFFPPGQLNLNRFETGFDFDFTSQK